METSSETIEHINLDINVDIILKCLWEIKGNDQFYFDAYGKEMIENYIEHKFKGINSKIGTSSEIIEQAKKRFKELEHKGFDWRSFYNGFLEAEAICVKKRIMENMR